MKKLLLLFCLLSSFAIHAQILDVTPTFPTINDNVTIIYDASQGNGALLDETPVYAHIGLITDESTAPNDWQFVQGDWGTADATVLMTSLGNNMHQIDIDLDVFFGFPTGTEVLQLAFVFRNEDGSAVGREADGGDIFYDVAPVGAFLQAALLDPSNNIIVNMGDQIEFSGSTNIAADIQLFDNGALIASETNTTVLTHTLTVSSGGSHDVVLVANSGSLTSSDTVNYVVNGSVTVMDPPAGTECGVNYNSPTSVTLSLYAPGKEYVYAIGDFSDWNAEPDYFMNRSVDGSTWWITIDGLTPGSHAYQYWIDGTGKYADACSELILDPWNDGSIDEETYPDPYPYPSGQTSGSATLFNTDPVPFSWQHDTYNRPDQTKMVIYELLLRDFIAAHNYITLIDSLDYLQNLGINAIELMPPGEFEGNDSWGYNPSFHMALDKYYGTPEAFKSFVDECHSRGMAVIVDMVLNHAFGQSPHAQMYWDAPNSQPAADNPWLNTECPSEPYCWGSDYDHTRQATQDYVDRVNTYWMEEYHVDGFRFDYTSGFHNGPAGGYSATRIDLIKRMADVVWSVDPNAYVILEHWCDNSEEIELSNHGCLLWGNLTYNYQESAMGYISGSNFEWGIYQQRGWADPHLVTYAESHDEERVTYKTLMFGNSNGNYDTQELLTAMARNELNAVFLLSQPGPKMIWQFGELGYEVSIDFDCRVCPKPIRWYYFGDNWRKKTYDVYAAMNFLRNNYPTFTSTNISHSLGGGFKRINLYHPDMDAVVIGNFDVEEQSGLPNFPYTGTWYDYFSGTEITEDNLSNEFLLQPGEYRVYTSQPIAQPDLAVTVDDLVELEIDMSIRPNPVVDFTELSFELEEAADLEIILYDMKGQRLQVITSGKYNAGSQQFSIDVSGLAAGEYAVLVAVNGRSAVRTIMKD